MKSKVVFLDTEVTLDGKVKDIGAVKWNGSVFHLNDPVKLTVFVDDAEFVCGHNVLHHDLKYLSGTDDITKFPFKVIDTLYLSPLLFPKRPYHNLVKDDKLQADDLNNPVNDCKKARELFNSEVTAYCHLDKDLRSLFICLLYDAPEFRGFFDFMESIPYRFNKERLLRHCFDGKICSNVNLKPLIDRYPVQLAYALALINTGDHHSVTPPWLVKNYPEVEGIMNMLCNTPCNDPNCPYCHLRLDIHKGLKMFFGFDAYRSFDGVPLQEKAVQAAVDGKSLLAVFPTGGGKSLTFQVPALMAGHNVHGLTVVISPLQSLMKDQVDNLEQKGITEAVTINGLLDPVARANAFERVADGSVSILYISPEMLRSRSIKKLLMDRHVVRFVIDEAHCFSAWGQDFRVDYLYIGDFIRELQMDKNLKRPIPVSCFTATAKRNVIIDICRYFKEKLGLDLVQLTASSSRENLQYAVIHADTDDEKFNQLDKLIAAFDCPTIVYVSRTRRTKDIAEKLCGRGIRALPFNGKMESDEKVRNQNAFINDDVKVIVATSAFGMGVDKKNVGLVVHYDISDSLENYVQEAGRAGRDPSMQAQCFILYTDSDLDKHFMLLNQTKLNFDEIQQVWKAVKTLTTKRTTVSLSPLELARHAGWDDTVVDIETRVKAAIAALEASGYVARGMNVPRIYATGIMAKNMDEARAKIEHSAIFSEKQKTDALRIIKSLITCRSIATAQDNDAESRVDYLADTLGIERADVVTAIGLMRQEQILDDSAEMKATVVKGDKKNSSVAVLERFARLEFALLSEFSDISPLMSLKELNEKAISQKVTGSSVKNIRTLLYFLTIKGYMERVEKEDSGTYTLVPLLSLEAMTERFNRRIGLCRFITAQLMQLVPKEVDADANTCLVNFSEVALLKAYRQQPHLDLDNHKVTLADVEEALLYLSKIDAMHIEGGFLVLYNAMELERKQATRLFYKKNDYSKLNAFYEQRIKQIHIVGEYAKMMSKDKEQAAAFERDYFQMDFDKFIDKYFEGDRKMEIAMNITAGKYKKIFGELSNVQRQIINDRDSKYIVVAAGPGSGKTRVLVHKLASLLLLEDVKHEQLLMLTFSRSAATEFKSRLRELVGGAMHYVEINTFHSYCFDLLGRPGNLDDARDVVYRAVEAIESGEVEQNRITKSVLVIDEAQDMDADEFALVQALISRNENMRVLAVGDDDQNIYEFRQASSRYMNSLITDYEARRYEMLENFRSGQTIVDLSNAFARKIRERMKSLPCVAANDQKGLVTLTHHVSGNLEVPVVNHIMNTYHGERACVLTNTNEEALHVVGLLTQNGIRAKLIQSMEGFSLGDLAEIRFFVKQISQHTNRDINKELWEKAKEKTLRQYADSTCIENVKGFIEAFETTNRDYYLADLKEFVNESAFEDFYEKDLDAIYVSTIHKSKGREFDTVYMLLDNVKAYRDEDYRKLFVGLTRAKSVLHVHYNDNLFAGIQMDDITYIEDPIVYPTPNTLTLQMTHRDVILDFFKGRKDCLLALHSGQTLEVRGNRLAVCVEGKWQQVVAFSAAFKEKVEELEKKGYLPCSATIRFVVAWRGKDDTEESAVVLSDVQFEKKE